MKKTFLLPLVLFLAFSFVVKAQSKWARSTADTTNIYNINSGNVGIGTTTPGTKLSVAGQSYLSSFVWQGSSAGTDMGFWFGAPGSFSQGLWVDNNSTLRLRNSSDALSVTTAGNVGIGTTSPVTALQVVAGTNQGVVIGTAGGAGYPSWMGTNGLYVDGSSRASQYVVGGGNPVQWGSGRSAIKGDDNGTTDSYLSFVTGRAAASAERMRIIDNGYIGIGTSTPDQMLTVNGTIHATEVLVDLSVPAPDYVFEKNYKLKSLPEIGRYIAVNKHLPEIPSAQHMTSNGVNLSEMNMKLLKKVEELTLYMIEENKTKKNQQAEIDMLKRQVSILSKIAHKTNY